MKAKLVCGGHRLDLARPQVMGILNVTPDSFSDGGDFFSPEKALARAREMVAEGAAIIDVGGESTRPGAESVSLQQELDRIIPVIEAMAVELPVPISVDTSKPEVMTEAVKAGAGMINDVCALRVAGALEAARDANVPVCLMHMQGDPRSMQHQPRYQDVVAEVLSFLKQRILECTTAGISCDRLLIDPGFGFGKQLEHNLRLFHHLSEFTSLELPVLVGVSRKSMIGQILDAEPEERLFGSLALAGLAVWQGASIIRAHDVRATADAVKLVYEVVKMN